VHSLHLAIATFAQETAPAAGGGQPAGCAGGGMQPFMLMGIMFVVFYFLLIRPQQKKAKEHANMINDLKKGDEVVTRGGVIGKVSGVQDNILVLEVQEKVRIRVLKSYVETKLAPGASAAAATSTAESR